MTPTAATGRPEREVDRILRDPAASRPLRRVLQDWLARDPVDAASDAAVLAEVLGRRADALLEGAPCS